jgi:AcrR family transcriptional regulator
VIDATSPPTGPEGHDPLPVAPPEPRLRADALRNRARLLKAATRLAAERGARNITLEAVATEAGVGKGTVSRRFGDRTGLLLALLDHQERRLQEAFLSGPPPFGPGADPASRLTAFGPGVLRHEREHLDLYLAAEPEAGRRFTVPARRLRLTHLTTLLRRSAPDADAELLAHTLLAFLDTALVDHLVSQRDMPLERLEAAWADLVTRLTRRGC